MKIAIRNRVDCEAGAFFLVIGIAVAVLATQYRLGTALNMGPGYFPLALGLLLALLGALILARGLMGRTTKTVVAFHTRQVVLVTLSILLFGLVLTFGGLLAATPVIVLVSLLAAPGYRWKTALILAVSLTVAAWLIFHVALNLRIPLIGGLD
jgi:hypothetical protein